MKSAGVAVWEVLDEPMKEVTEIWPALVAWAGLTGVTVKINRCTRGRLRLLINRISCSVEKPSSQTSLQLFGVSKFLAGVG